MILASTSPNIFTKEGFDKLNERVYFEVCNTKKASIVVPLISQYSVTSSRRSYSTVFDDVPRTRKLLARLIVCVPAQLLAKLLAVAF